MTQKSDYTGEKIQVLEGLEGVRRRPSMYIGSTGRDGLHHLVYEVVDNSVDEALAGYCKKIKVILNKDGSATIEDDGRGIPVDKHSTQKIPAVEVALTKLHAGGKFDKKSYMISGGLHGVGVSVVNALSKKLVVEIKREGKIYQQEYSRGITKTKLKTLGKTNETGTKITFWPDSQIFSTIDFDSKVLETRFREIVFLNPGLKIILIDDIKNKKEEFFAAGGLIEFVKWINSSKEVLHKPIYFKREENSTVVEVSIQYNSGYQENIFGFVNTINTVEGGTHVSGFKTALTRVINDYARKKGLLKNGSLSGDDVREGLITIISIKMADPQFEGQTKTKLGNSDIKGIVDSMVTSALSEYFEENPAVAKKITSKSLDSAKARLAAKRAKDLVRRKNAFSLGGLPGKLADCSSKKSDSTEIYIVEGESAGGCFSGETKIALADGRNISFKELIKEFKDGKENYCYTIKKDGGIGIEKIENPRLTKENAEVIKIILDNGEEVICTPDHKFMLRDGSYKRVQFLTKDDSLMPLNTFCQRFFNNDKNLMLNAIENYNHKIKKIEVLKEKIDVYDIEVPETHNFALASGVFVHNSAKMGRDRNIQAILPLKGKILNVEKASPVRSLSSEEIANLITAIGTGVGEEFNLEKLRYNKIIIMSIDGEEATFVQSPQGEISFVKVGEFIDTLIEKKINPAKYKVLCFSLNSNKTQFKAIKAVIKHPLKDILYEVKSSYGRNVKITSSHSIFVFEKGEIKLKKGSQIKKGDRIVAPRNLPLYNYNFPSKLDLLSFFIKNRDKIKDDLYIRGGSAEELMKAKVKKFYRGNSEFTGERIIIPEDFGKFLTKKRKDSELSQKFLCKNLNVKQPCVYYNWEKGKNKPLLKNFEGYLKVLKINEKRGLSQVQIVESKLDNIWNNQYKSSGRNKVKNYIRFSELQKEDLEFLGDEIKICPTHYRHKGINRFVFINEHLAKLIGFWIAEGSCSLRNGIKIAIGNNNHVFVPELKKAFKDVFGIEGKLSKYSNRCDELKLVNKAAALFWKNLFAFSQSLAINKKIPNLIFNLSKKMQLEFLRGYFLGDGTISKNGISFTTVSKDLANQLMYLLQSFGIVAGMKVKEPSANNRILSRNLAYIINITSREDLIRLKRIWENHKNANYLDKKLNSTRPSINRKFEIISEDLIALDVKEVKEVESSNGEVYDFSVEEDENFIAGFGGLCCHNTDADVDGEHIKTLLLTFFFRFMRPLIENGNVYVALPPLFRIRKGQKDNYVYSERELKKFTEKFGSGAVTRFKGLGEMSSTQLWETTMSPKSRKIKKIFIEDAVEADKTFSMLMGDDVQSRKKFIQENAQEATLDV